MGNPNMSEDEINLEFTFDLTVSSSFLIEGTYSEEYLADLKEEKRLEIIQEIIRVIQENTNTVVLDYEQEIE